MIWISSDVLSRRRIRLIVVRQAFTGLGEKMFLFFIFTFKMYNLNAVEIRTRSGGKRLFFFFSTVNPLKLLAVDETHQLSNNDNCENDFIRITVLCITYGFDGKIRLRITKRDRRLK